MNDNKTTITAKWIKATGMMPPEFMGGYVCSNCDNWAPRDYYKTKLWLSPYCPTCGAYMINWKEYN